MYNKFFKSQSYNMPIYKHLTLPLYETSEFDFYRCVQFDESMYYKTLSELHAGNLRKSIDGRYSKIFGDQKISYWTNSPDIARKEVKRHGANKNLLTFHAYDDASSFIPTTSNAEHLLIIDGRPSGLQDIIDKIEDNEKLTNDELNIMDELLACDPDCLAYESKASDKGENFIFLEKGFNKLSVFSLRLHLGETKSRNHDCIYAAGSSDYTPYLESYGEYFAPICRVKMDESYLKSEEYRDRQMCFNKRIEDISHRK